MNWLQLLFDLLLILQICGAIKSDIIESISGNIKISMVVPAVKHSQRKRNNGFCTILNSSFTQTNDEMIFTFEIEDKIPQHANIDRFGTTSGMRGKQSTNFVLYGLTTHDLFRSKRGLRNGISSFLIEPKQEKLFKLCFFNYVYDGSWRSIDTDKYVTIQLSRREVLDLDRHEFMKKHITPVTKIELENSISHLEYIIDNSGTQQLLSIEKYHRNVNEDTFESLLYAMAIYTSAVMISNALQLWFIRKKILIKNDLYL